MENTFLSTLLFLVEKSLLSALATFGIALVFNVSKRILPLIFFLGMATGFVKFSTLLWLDNIVLSSFLASIFLGFAALALDKKSHSTPFALCIPPLICMLPGIYAYNALLAIIELSGQEAADKSALLIGIVSNIISVFAILFALVIGVVVATMKTRRYIYGMPKKHK